jgi:hypothetical protein
MADILETHGNSGFPTANFWRGTSPISLTVLDFIFYVASPHVVNMLISQDLSVTEAEADRVCLESLQHGLHFHEINDEIDEQAMRIAISKHVRKLVVPSFNSLNIHTS